MGCIRCSSPPPPRRSLKSSHKQSSGVSDTSKVIRGVCVCGGGGILSVLYTVEEMQRMKRTDQEGGEPRNIWPPHQM